MSEYLERLRIDKLISDEFNEFEHSFSLPGKLYFIARPREPYSDILDLFISFPIKRIIPEDSESKLFFPYIMVVDSVDEAVELSKKSDYGGVIVKKGTIITWGKREDTMIAVMFGTICYTLSVKFFSLMLKKRKKKRLGKSELIILNRVRENLVKYSTDVFDARYGPLKTETEIIEGMKRAGKEMVEIGLVNSFFGNISYRMGEKIFISQTGAYLDSLDKNIVECGLKDNVKCLKKASSEFPSHLEIFKKCNCKAIIHGHPLFTVILSMECDIKNCRKSDKCFKMCNFDREIFGIPIVSGETGSGRYGLDKVLPDKIGNFGKAIVYGHGIFIAGKDDFRKAISEMIEIEKMCKNEYFKKF